MRYVKPARAVSRALTWSRQVAAACVLWHIVKTPEQEAVLRSIRKLIDFWQIAPEELVPSSSDSPAVAAPVTVVALPKYRHPVSGDTWNGQGTQPQWLRDALTRQGYTVDELRVPPEPDEPCDT